MTKEANAKAIEAKAKAAAAKRVNDQRAKLTAVKPGDTLESLRALVADKATSDYGATGRYAALLTSTYGAGWQDTDLSGKADKDTNTQAAIRAERSSLFDLLKLHSNPSVVWGRVKSHAAKADDAIAKAKAKADAENREAAMTPEEKAEAEKAEAAAKADAKAKDLLNRVLDNLRALDNALNKVGPANLADEMRKAQVKMQEAIKALDANFVPAKAK